MIRGLASLCYRRRGFVVLAWLALVPMFFAFGSVLGTGFRTDFGPPPGSESAEAVDMLERNGFADRTGQQAQVVFESDLPATEPTVREAVERLLQAIAEANEDVSISSPYSPAGAGQISGDGGVFYAEINIPERTVEEYADVAESVRALATDFEHAGLRVELGGEIFVEEAPPSSEIFGLLGAVVILLLAFGSVLAMLLPVGMALFGIGGSIGLIEAATRWVDMPDFTVAAAGMIGIGVGIDYALLVVTRFRQEMRRQSDTERAVVIALDTAGRSVLFAGLTVVISLLGMVFMGMEMITGVAVACAAAVLMTMFASLTLLPAVLGFAGARIDALGLPWRGRHSEGGKGSVAYRWSRLVQKHPWPPLVLGTVLLLALTAPVLDMRLGFADAGSRPETDTTRQAYDLLSEGFGPGFNGSMLVVAEWDQSTGETGGLEGATTLLRGLDGVASVSEPFVSEAGSAAAWQITPSASPQDREAGALAELLRETVAPQLAADLDADVRVGGITAAAHDFASITSERLPVFIAVVLALSFVLLTAVFRGVLVAAKAVLMNLLSIGAAYGVIVIIFQWGVGGDLLDIGKPGPVEAWAPMMLFAILFGLSMDYEVFLLSRVREEYDRTGDNATAVANGLAATARVITAAAAIMVVVFGSFALGDDRSLKLFGTGLAAAILLDATVVRMVIVPSAMELLGDRNWWMPRWLDRVLPRLHGTRIG